MHEIPCAKDIPSSQNSSCAPAIRAATGARPLETVTKEGGQGDRRRVFGHDLNVSSLIGHRLVSLNVPRPRLRRVVALRCPPLASLAPSYPARGTGSRPRVGRVAGGGAASGVSAGALQHALQVPQARFATRRHQRDRGRRDRLPLRATIRGRPSRVGFGSSSLRQRPSSSWPSRTPSS